MSMQSAGLMRHDHCAIARHSILHAGQACTMQAQQNPAYLHSQDDTEDSGAQSLSGLVMEPV